MKNEKRILLIDDEEVMHFGFTKVLQEPGVVLDSALTFEEAKKCITTRLYDAAIVDLRLSNSTHMEGFDCIRLLRSLQNRCRILMMTAYGDNYSRARAETLGVDLFLEKPIEPYSVRDILKRFGIYKN
jgi:DNA-binding response OmpR family regulator